MLVLQSVVLVNMEEKGDVGSGQTALPLQASRVYCGQDIPAEIEYRGGAPNNGSWSGTVLKKESAESCYKIQVAERLSSLLMGGRMSSYNQVTASGGKTTLVKNYPFQWALGSFPLEALSIKVPKQQ